LPFRASDRSARRAILVGVASTVVCFAAAAPASAADLLVAPGGSDGGPCTQATPCASFSRAYQVSLPGQVVRVAPGAYGTQTIPDAGKSGARIVFAPASGRPTLTGITVRGDHVEVSDIGTGWLDIEAAADVVIRNGEGTGLFIGKGTTDITIAGGAYGGGAANTTPVKIQGSPPPTGVTLDGVVFHDAVRTDTSSHLECIYAADVQRFTVRNSQFRNCAIMDLFFTNLSGVDPRDVLVENNFFDRTGSHAGQYAANSRGYYSLMVSGSVQVASNFTIRHNSFAQSPLIDPGSIAGVRVSSNVGPLATCRSGITYSHNVWSDRTCGGTDKQAASGFANVGNYDLKLLPGSAAIDAGDPADGVATDIEGQQRSGLPDAGADELGSPTAGGAPGGAGQPDPAGKPRGGKRKRVLRLKVRRLSRQRWRFTASGQRVGRARLVLQRRQNGHWRTQRTWRLRLGQQRRVSRKIRVRRGSPARLVLRAPGAPKKVVRLR
jgi:hypothetical protein